MTTTDNKLIAETRALIKEVESGDTAHAAWVAIQDRVKQLYANRTQAEVGDLLGKNKAWVGQMLAWDCTSAHTPFATASEVGRTARERSNKAAAKKVARENPEALIAALPAPAVEKLARVATESIVEHARAQRQEHDTKPKVGDEKIVPADEWIDTLVIRINRNARELAKRPFLLGSMSVEEAFDYLDEAERLIAEKRAAAQELLRDGRVNV